MRAMVDMAGAMRERVARVRLAGSTWALCVAIACSSTSERPAPRADPPADARRADAQRATASGAQVFSPIGQKQHEEARAYTEWVLDKDCAGLHKANEEALSASLYLLSYRLRLLATPADGPDNDEHRERVTAALERISRCRVFRSGHIGDFPPHVPPGLREDPTR